MSRPHGGAQANLGWRLEELAQEGAAALRSTALELCREQDRRWHYLRARVPPLTVQLRQDKGLAPLSPVQLELLRVEPAPRPLDPERLRAQLIANGFPGVLR